MVVETKKHTLIKVRLHTDCEHRRIKFRLHTVLAFFAMAEEPPTHPTDKYRPIASCQATGCREEQMRMWINFLCDLSTGDFDRSNVTRNAMHIRDAIVQFQEKKRKRQQLTRSAKATNNKNPTDQETIWILDADIEYLADILQEKIAHRNEKVREMARRLKAEDSWLTNCSCGEMGPLCLFCRNGAVDPPPRPTLGDSVLDPVFRARLKAAHDKQILEGQ